MVKEIRIYVEGGGDQTQSKANLRRGLNTFLNEIVQTVRAKRVRWNVIACGSRNDTYKNFINALKVHPHAFNILLVDSEGPVNSEPLSYLSNRDNWLLSDTTSDNCHLMAQTTETWLAADPEALSQFYGQGFKQNLFPRQSNLELTPKAEVYSILKEATKDTSKEAYHKTRHLPKLLEIIDSAKVREVAPHCDRLFNTLSKILENPN